MNVRDPRLSRNNVPGLPHELQVNNRNSAEFFAVQPRAMEGNSNVGQQHVFMNRCPQTNFLQHRQLAGFQGPHCQPPPRFYPPPAVGLPPNHISLPYNYTPPNSNCGNNNNFGRNRPIYNNFNTTPPSVINVPNYPPPSVVFRDQKCSRQDENWEAKSLAFLDENIQHKKNQDDHRSARKRSRSTSPTDSRDSVRNSNNRRNVSSRSYSYGRQSTGSHSSDHRDKTEGRRSNSSRRSRSPSRKESFKSSRSSTRENPTKRSELKRSGPSQSRFTSKDTAQRTQTDLNENPSNDPNGSKLRSVTDIVYTDKIESNTPSSSSTNEGKDNESEEQNTRKPQVTLDKDLVPLKDDEQQKSDVNEEHTSSGPCRKTSQSQSQVDSSSRSRSNERYSRSRSRDKSSSSRSGRRSRSSSSSRSRRRDRSRSSSRGRHNYSSRRRSRTRSGSRSSSSSSRSSYRRRSRSRRRSTSPRYKRSSSRRGRSRSYTRSRSRDRRSYRKRSRDGRDRRSRSRSRSSYRRRRSRSRSTSRSGYKNLRSSKYLAELEKICNKNPDEIRKDAEKHWFRSAPATTYYTPDESNANVMCGTQKLLNISNQFADLLIKAPQGIKKNQESDTPKPPQWRKWKRHTCTHHAPHSSDDSSDEDTKLFGDEESQIMEELQLKIQHPFRLHRELWHNEVGEMNDGPLCKCSIKARRTGIRHGIYVGESENTWRCNPNSNNADKLYHYRVTISPATNFLSKVPTVIPYDEHEFIFEGFSLLSHYKLPDLPVCKVIRFNIEYTILYIEEKNPDNFTIEECNLFFEYLFREILELLDLDLYSNDEKCAMFHFMPRFVRSLPEEGYELLPTCLVLKHFLTSYQPLVPEEMAKDISEISKADWLAFSESVKGMIVTKPGMKPSSIRLDHIDRDRENNTDEEKSSCNEKPDAKCSHSDIDQSKDSTSYPLLIHFGVRPPQLSYAGNQDYQKAWREYVKLRHLVANLAKPSADDRNRLKSKELNLHKMRTRNNMKRDVTATLSSEGFYKTGLMCDVVQHAMLIPVLTCHLRFHRSLDVLEEKIAYKFKNRYLLQLALTHPSYRENFGTNADHARNSLTNCGIRQPEFGDRRIHYMRSKKRGISTLINIMSRLGCAREEESRIYHNERLEFLGDAVVEFSATIHLYFMFRDLEEGGLATYRAALVQNQYLAVLSKSLNLDSFLLFAHGSDLCHDLELKHALANCFEALMGALFLDGGIQVADRIFGETAFGDDSKLLKAWHSICQHAIQEQEPDGDRHWIEKIEYLQKLTQFEENTGIQFKHIRLLARAFTDKSIGYTNLTLGSNQRLEFLGDSVLQLVASEYLYRHFPDHHEGHLSLLRSSLVNNKTQSVVCDDLDMTSYARYSAAKTDLKVKDRADLLEAFLGAIFVDKRDLRWVQQFCNVCFFPRLRDFIMNQDWNDPKSKLQQCCLTLRTMNGGEPDIPHYKVVECKGPTNTRTYTVAVYFRQKRLATASGHSIQQAEMNAAQTAMDSCTKLFPQLDQQKKILAKAKIQASDSNRYYRRKEI